MISIFVIFFSKKKKKNHLKLSFFDNFPIALTLSIHYLWIYTFLLWLYMFDICYLLHEQLIKHQNWPFWIEFFHNVVFFYFFVVWTVIFCFYISTHSIFVLLHKKQFKLNLGDFCNKNNKKTNKIYHSQLCFFGQFQIRWGNIVYYNQKYIWFQALKL